MLMTDISQYIELNGRATLLDLSRRFQIQESAMQQMLLFWLKKGKIELVDATAIDNCSTGKKCSDCFECSDSAHQVYIWRG
ncbi:FeoC-like transcriptional regulator [Orbus hercynius]|uniref:FeoC-like transcriptional regulator n=1 Tax=Orbus hercynius TaxID=593135 RepID=A0A495RD93_9GAMM|nr:FeoC-like transcriptional regulator [Orbus hercynius]RKS85184.1 FeoC-like transcriptional regulator [Orbus hercynius]